MSKQQSSSDKNNDKNFSALNCYLNVEFVGFFNETPKWKLEKFLQRRLVICYRQR